MNFAGNDSGSKYWLAHIAESFRQLSIGFVVFVVAFPLLFWNESGTARLSQTFERDSLQVKTIEANDWQGAQQHSLVYLHGQATTNEELVDHDFRIKSKSIKLRRVVESYQWQEMLLEGKGRREGEVRYAKVWSEKPIASAKFQQPEGHENPSMTMRSKILAAKEVRLGAFKLNREQVSRIDKYERMPVSADMVAWLPEDRRVGLSVKNNHIVYAQHPKSENPTVGDVRIHYESVRPQWVSVLARPTEDSFAAYATPDGKTIDELRLGVVPLKEMADFPQPASTIGVWFLRAIGFFAMTIGLALMAQPLVTLPNLVPVIQMLLGRGPNVFAVCLAATGTLLTIGFAWLLYQPTFAVTMIATAALLVGLFVVWNRRVSTFAQ